MHQSIEGISIEAVAACVPKRIVKNADFEHLLNPREIKKFEKLTGIKSRRFADIKTTASDLGLRAANKILDDLNCHNDIKALIFLSQTADYKIPFIAGKCAISLMRTWQLAAICSRYPATRHGGRFVSKITRWLYTSLPAKTLCMARRTNWLPRIFLPIR